MNKIVKKIFSTPSLRLSSTTFLEVVFILSVLLAVMFYFSRKTLRMESTMDAEQTLEATMLHVDNVLASVEQSVGNVYWDLMAHLDQPDRIETYCRNMVKCNANIMACAIGFKPGYWTIPEQEMVYVQRRRYDSQELSASHTFGTTPYTQQTWYAGPMKNGHTGWINARKSDLAEGGVVITYALPIYKRGVSPDAESERETIGVFAVDVSANLLSEIVLAAKPSPHSFCLLLDKDGSFIVHPDPEVLANHTVATLKEAGADTAMVAAGEAMMTGETGNRIFRLKGEEMHIFYKPFVRSSSRRQSTASMGWSIGIVYPDHDIFGVYNNMLLQVLKTTAIGLLVFFLLTRMITRGQLKPLAKLTESAQRIAEDDYSENMDDTKRNDEIGQFQKNFKLMQQSLVTHVDELEQLKATLEEHRETLRKTYEQTQEDDRVKTTFLRRMSNQLIPPAEAISQSVNRLCDNYQNLSQQEAYHEMDTIKQQGEQTLRLLNQIVNTTDEQTGKEAAHE